MIRKELINISEEDFINIIKPHNCAIDKYIESKLYDYVSYYIAKGYEFSSLWKSSLENQVNSAIDTLCGIKFKNNFDYLKLKMILR